MTLRTAFIDFGEPVMTRALVSLSAMMRVRPSMPPPPPAAAGAPPAGLFAASACCA
jgi:hypothetical protein